MQELLGAPLATWKHPYAPNNVPQGEREYWSYGSERRDRTGYCLANVVFDVDGGVVDLYASHED